MERTLPPNTVRGRIRDYIVRNREYLKGRVLEIGSRSTHEAAWWTTNRDLAPAGTDWIGIDMQPGLFVDQVVNACDMPVGWAGSFDAVLCSEALEHIDQYWRALSGILRVLKDGGVAIFTTLTAFPIHGFPNDYRRWTAAGLALDLKVAGFRDIQTEQAGEVTFTLNDHGEANDTVLKCPIHVFARAVK